MKYLIVALLWVLTPIVIVAQNNYHLSKVSVYFWEEPQKQYVLFETRDCNLTLYSSESFFSINNELKSSFSTKKKIFDEVTDLVDFVAWSAENETKKPCTIKMLLYKKETRLEFQVVFVDIMIVYRIN